MISSSLMALNPICVLVALKCMYTSDSDLSSELKSWVPNSWLELSNRISHQAFQIKHALDGIFLPSSPPSPRSFLMVPQLSQLPFSQPLQAETWALSCFPFFSSPNTHSIRKTCQCPPQHVFHICTLLPVSTATTLVPAQPPHLDSCQASGSS